MRTNFHTHTQRCLHAFGDEEDYVIEAVKRNVQQLGFSDHAPFPDKDFGLRMQFSELRDYLETIDRLNVKYDNIQLFKGLEIEYHPMYEDYYKQLFDVYKLDYLILGEHMYTLPDGDIKNIYFAQSTEDYLDYAKGVCDGIKTGLFNIVAHPDLMLMNKFAWDDNCQKATEMIIESAEKYNVVLEFNANGYRRGETVYPDGKRYPYPDVRFWNMVKKTNIRVLVGSDCHEPHQVFDGKVEFAYKTANQIGLNIIETIF